MSKVIGTRYNTQNYPSTACLLILEANFELGIPFRGTWQNSLSDVTSRDLTWNFWNRHLKLFSCSWNLITKTKGWQGQWTSKWIKNWNATFSNKNLDPNMESSLVWLTVEYKTYLRTLNYELSLGWPRSSLMEGGTQQPIGTHCLSTSWLSSNYLAQCFMIRGVQQSFQIGPNQITRYRLSWKQTTTTGQ